MVPDTGGFVMTNRRLAKTIGEAFTACEFLGAWAAARPFEYYLETGKALADPGGFPLGPPR